MKKQDTSLTSQIKSQREVLGLLGEQLESLRPQNKPTQESVSAARASATVVNSYLGTIRVGMEYAKMNGNKPDLTFLDVPIQSNNTAIAN